MSIAVSVIDGMTNATDDDLSGFQTDFLGQPGVVSSPQYTTPFQGTQTGTPDKHSNVAAGVAYIPNSTTSPTQYFRIVNDAVVQVLHPDTASNPRIDSVVLFLDLGATPNANATNVASVELIQGSEAGSPVAPSDSDITTALGAATWIRLYNVAIDNPLVSVVDADISDLRPVAALDTRKLGVIHNGSLGYLFDKEVTIRGTAPVLRFEETDGSSDEKNWQWDANGGSLELTAWDDSYGSGTLCMIVKRTGIVIDSVEFPSRVLVGDSAAFAASKVRLFLNEGGTSGTIEARAQTIVAGNPIGFYFGADINHPYVGTYTAHNLRFITNGTYRGRIDTAGDLTMLNGAGIYAASIGNDKSIVIAHDDSNGIVRANQGDLLFDSQTKIMRTAAAGKFRWYESGNTNYGTLEHDGSSAILSTNSGNVAVAPASNVFAPAQNNTISLGSSSFKWTTVYATTGAINTSDIRQKTVQEDAEVLGLDFVNTLEPIAYKWKEAYKNVEVEITETIINEDGEEEEVTVTRKEAVLKTENEKRVHFGLSAQQVEEAMTEAGLTDMDFAGLVIDEETGDYGLRYDQFIPILINAVKELTGRLTAAGI